jgi:alpha-ketoglutarate-dependent taurine dioxygenase
LIPLNDFVAKLASIDVKIWCDGGNLRVSGPDRYMTPELRSELAEHKAGLLAFLSESAPDDAVAAAAGVTPTAGPAPVVIDHEIEWPFAWQKADLPREAGFVKVSGACASEIAQLATDLRNNPHPIEALRPEEFDLPECHSMMAEVKRELVEGIGFAVIDCLDIEAIGQDAARAVCWLLCAMVERPVAQNWKGAMYYDVSDRGKRSMRAVNTRDEIVYHTDNSFNVCPPNYVGLLCLQKAKSGGMSKIVNFAAAHNEMRRRHPELLARAYLPYVFDRQHEHAPDEERVIRRPIFENHDGRMVGRVSRFHIRTGHALAGVPLDPEGEAAIDAIESIMNEDGMAHEFWFEQGQIQIVDNRRLGHKRTAFEDWDEPEKKRRLMRLWLRDGERPFYNG